MCGGREENFWRAEPILKELSGSLRYIGKSGEDAKVKALVNMVMNINTAGLAEGLGLGRARLDMLLLRVSRSRRSRVLQTDGEDMQNRTRCFFGRACRKTAASRFNSHAVSVSIFLARAPKNNVTRLLKDWASSTNQASPSSPSKIGINIPAITFESVLDRSTIARHRPRSACYSRSARRPALSWRNCSALVR